jgi:MATE family multidrug resistance protein
MLLFAAYRSFLASVNVTRPLLLAAALGNVANALLCFWLVGGGLGVAAQGALGVAWSTSICRVVLLLPLALIVHFRRDFKQFPQVSWAPDWPLLGRLARIGAPIGFQLSAEVGSFSAAAVLIGTFGTVALAAHQLAINVASMLFMVPLGLSAAAAVRTGNAFGRGDLPGMARAGWTSFGTGFAFAVTSALVLTLFPEAILSVFRPDQDVALIALDFLAVAALFQIGDSLQVVGMGVLRGLGDTRVSMIFVLLGYAGVAVPAGLLGAFVWSHDPRWIWGGLAIGLLVVAVLLVGRFRWQTTKVARERGAAAVVAAAAM